MTSLPSSNSIVRQWLALNAGSNRFLASLRDQVRPLSAGQIDSATRNMEQANTLAYRAHLATIAPVSTIVTLASAERAYAAVLANRAVPAGTYTIALADATNWVTLRVKANKNPKYADTLDVLTGADNSTSFTPVGEVAASGFRAYTERRLETMFWIDSSAVLATLARRDVALAIDVLFNEDADLDAAGVTYAMKSSRCRSCNRKLTVPASLYAGRGPECRGKANPAKVALAMAA